MVEPHCSLLLSYCGASLFLMLHIIRVLIVKYHNKHHNKEFRYWLCPVLCSQISVTKPINSPRPIVLLGRVNCLRTVFHMRFQVHCPHTSQRQSRILLFPKTPITFLMVHSCKPLLKRWLLLVQHVRITLIIMWYDICIVPRSVRPSNLVSTLSQNVVLK